MSRTSRWAPSFCRVLGEGSFLNLLSFLERHAPDPVTRRVAHLALQDEAGTSPSGWPTSSTR